MLRVLYAEDDAQVADMVRLSFARHPSCRLEIVNNGRDCLQAMLNPEHDVLLLDLVMPDINGLQVLSELIARRESRPVIMVSAHGQNDLAVRALRAGAVDCIDKNSAEFLRIPEIVQRVHARHPRQAASPLADSPREHTVLFLDPDESERESMGLFLAGSLPNLKLLAHDPAELDTVGRSNSRFDAVIIGPTVPAEQALALIRLLRPVEERLPVIVISSSKSAEDTIAAFKLGAHDYLLNGPDCPGELAFSLNNALKQVDTEKLNAQLAGELTKLNRSLAQQVATRTHELEKEIEVRRDAERSSEVNAARLQALSTRLLRVQEDERHALAQELHDQIGQLLTGLRFQLESARTAAPNPSVDHALTITDELLRSIRAITLQLRPRLLDDLGLRPALEWHAKVFQNQTGISVDLELSLPEHRLDARLEIAVFRMVQEALTNVARHSGASAASVTVTADDVALQVEVSDRGSGFDTAKAFSRHDSLGLTGLVERVRSAGGKLDLFSRPGQGTRVHAEFPLTTRTSPQ